MGATGRSSLRQYDRLADRIRLHRQARRVPVLIVEGITDERVVRELIRHEVDIFVAGNRAEVLLGLSESAQHRISDLGGLVDRDFDNEVLAASRRGLPVVAYDGADVESALFDSPALERLLEEMASTEKLGKFGGIGAVRRFIVECIAPLSRLRTLNSGGGLGIRFDAVDVGARMKVQQPQLEAGRLVDALLRASDEIAMDRSRLVECAESGKRQTCPDSGGEIFRGRDALAVLGVLLRSKIGSCDRQQVSVEHLESVLRLSVRIEDAAEMPWVGRVLDLFNPAA